MLAIYRGEEALRTDLQELSEDRNFVVVTDFPRQEVVREHKVKEALSFFTLALCLVLFTPLPVSVCLLTGANPAVFALTVALATSNSFLIPTHQVNALIMGPVGYRVTDFLRAGGVMTLLFLIVIVGMLNLVY